MLALLRAKAGFKGRRMVGVDYSQGSIQLARELYPEDTTGIRFEVWDVFSLSQCPSQFDGDDLPDWFPSSEGGFDIVLDKGTFDAISLSSDPVPSSSPNESENSSASGQRICEVYPSIAKRLVKPGGYLVVTSCNWTEEELVRWFVTPDSGDQGERKTGVFGRVEYPRFRFGGMEGQGVCTVCFRVD